MRFKCHGKWATQGQFSWLWMVCRKVKHRTSLGSLHWLLFNFNINPTVLINLHVPAAEKLHAAFAMLHRWDGDEQSLVFARHSVGSSVHQTNQIFFFLMLSKPYKCHLSNSKKAAEIFIPLPGSPISAENLWDSLSMTHGRGRFWQFWTRLSMYSVTVTLSGYCLSLSLMALHHRQSLSFCFIIILSQTVVHIL